MSLLVLKKGPATTPAIVSTAATDDESAFGRIRCPLCAWQPDASSRWCCESAGTPERFVGGCGAVWNTFDTRGQCPGCGHQWRWTSCLRCAGWSLHDDWYEHSDR